MTARKAPAKPVANLAAARKEQAQSRQRHPAGKQAPQKPAKPAQGVVSGVVSGGGTSRGGTSGVVPPQPVEKRTYSATGRSGKVNTRTSATVLTHAVDVKIAGRKGAQFAAGVVVQMYASEAAASKAAHEINSGAAGPEWSDAIVVPVKAVTTKAAS